MLNVGGGGPGARLLQEVPQPYPVILCEVAVRVILSPQHEVAKLLPQPVQQRQQQRAAGLGDPAQTKTHYKLRKQN